MASDFGLLLVKLIVLFLIGGVIGLIVVALVYWKLPRRRHFLRAAIFAGLMFVFASKFAAWADSGSYYVNGIRENVSRWRGAIANNAELAVVTSAVCAALLSGVGGRRPRANDRRPT